MASRAILCLLLATSTQAHRGPRIPRDLREEFFVSRLAVDDPLPLSGTPKITENVMELQRTKGSSLSSMYINAIRAKGSGADPYYSRIKQVSRKVDT